MSKIAQLREQRDVKSRAANDLNAKYPADQRMPAAEAAQLDTLLAEIDNIDSEITRANRVAQLAVSGDASSDTVRQAQHEIALAAAVAAGNGNGQSPESRALRSFCQGGLQNMAEADRGRMIARQSPDIRAAMSTTVGAEGGFTVSPEYQRSLEVAMKSYGGMRQVAAIIRTATGAQMNFPATDPTAEEGEIVGQNATVARLDTVFSNITLDVYKYSSKDIAIPFELLQDSFIDLETYINELMGMRIGRITNKHYQIGTGTGQPRGMSVAAAVGKTGTTGQTTTVLYDDLIDLEHSVDPSYRAAPGVGYIMHDASLRVLRKIKDTNGRPIFVPGYEAGNPGGAPDRLLNRPITIDQFVPVMAVNAKSIGFGNFKKYIIRDVMDLTLFRMTDSAFTRNGQVGFLGMMRSGGNMVDVGGGVKFYQNSAT